MTSIHIPILIFAANDPEMLIQTRYSAYASENYDFIIQTTSPKSSDYQAFMETALAPEPKKALSRWRRSIKSTMTEGIVSFIRSYIESMLRRSTIAFLFIGYAYTKFEIDEVQHIDENHVNVTWRHLAVRHADNVMFPIEEVSKLEKVQGDKWLYISGDVRRPKTEVSSEMVEKWPSMVGMELKPKVSEDGKTEAPIVM